MITRLAPFAALAALLALSCAHGPPVYRPPADGSRVFLGPPEAPEAPRTEGGSRTPADPEGPHLVVVTLEDARPMHHRIAYPDWLEEQGGWTGQAPTRDAAYRRALPDLVSDALAATLRETGRFGSVRRAAPGEPVEADLLLTGRLRRYRGWQAYHVDPGESARVLESLGDVFIDRLEIVDARTGRLAFAAQAGSQSTELTDALDPYTPVHRALNEALADLAAQLAEADLGRQLAREVALPADARGDVASLVGSAPEGWRVERRAPAAPRGWTGAAACEAVHLEDATRWYWHPMLGRYRAAVDVWTCPAGYEAKVHLDGPDGERFPAEVVGFGEDGSATFALALGASTWSDAAGDLTRFFGLAPADGPILRVPAPPPEARPRLGPPSF